MADFPKFEQGFILAKFSKIQQFKRLETLKLCRLLAFELKFRYSLPLLYAKCYADVAAISRN